MLRRFLISYIFWCFKTLAVPKQKSQVKTSTKKYYEQRHSREAVNFDIHGCLPQNVWNCETKKLLTSQKVQFETKLSFTLQFFWHFETNCASPHNFFGTTRQNWNFFHQTFGTENKFVYLATKFLTPCDKVVISAKQIFQIFWYSGEIMYFRNVSFCQVDLRCGSNFVHCFFNGL